MNRRSLLSALPLLAAPRLARAQQPIQIVDVLGRSVTLPRPARRIVLTQARHVLAMGLLHPDPVSLVTGWGDDLRRMNPPDYAMVRARFPQADTIPIVLRSQADGLSLEQLLDSRPDVVVAGLAILRDGLPERLAAMGIPVVAVDFFYDPMKNTLRSMEVLGKVTGREGQAAAFDAFYTERLAAISDRLKGLGADRPKIFIHAHAGGTACCASPGQGAYDSMIRFSGAHNIGADLIPGAVGDVSLENLIIQDPRVYVATGGPFGGRGGIPLGPGVSLETAQKELVAVIRRSQLDVLPAVQAGRAHTIWHGFNDTPAHVVMLEALARWFHPERCGDLDPVTTLAALNDRFLAIPMQGTHWADLPAGAL
jgi:iron complex transport system substrate-binding protein